jgi:3-hydroxyisobutyrate dehydrogenase-like beta-hydroxyacid dehydrogenase
MASHLLKAGFAVAVYDLQPAAIERIVADGARAMGSPREVAERSEVIIVMVVDDEQTTAVVAGPDGVLDGAGPGTVVILCSSLRPSTVHKLQAIAQPRGVELADAPVTGGERGAIDGKLTFLVGASPATFERIRPVLRAMGPTAEHVGPAGSGQVVKVVHNLLLWAELAATSEALQLAARLGVGGADVRRALQDCPANNWALARWEDTDNIPWAGKDLSGALAIADEIGAPMPLAGLVRELMKGWSRPDLPGAGGIGPTEETRR